MPAQSATDFSHYNLDSSIRMVARESRILSFNQFLQPHPSVRRAKCLAHSCSCSSSTGGVQHSSTQHTRAAAQEDQHTARSTKTTMPAKRRRRAIACLAAAAAPTTKALRLGGLRRPRPPPSIPRAGAETVAEHIAEDPRHTEAMREEVVVSSAMTARECVPPRAGSARELGPVGPRLGERPGRALRRLRRRVAALAGRARRIARAFLAKPPEAVLRADEDLDDALARVVNRGSAARCRWWTRTAVHKSNCRASRNRLTG